MSGTSPDPGTQKRRMEEMQFSSKSSGEVRQLKSRVSALCGELAYRHASMHRAAGDMEVEEGETGNQICWGKVIKLEFNLKE